MSELSSGCAASPVMVEVSSGPALAVSPDRRKSNWGSSSEPALLAELVSGAARC